MKFDIPELEQMGAEYSQAQDKYFELQKQYFAEMVKYCENASDDNITGEVVEMNFHKCYHNNFVEVTIAFNDGMTEEFSDYYGLPLLEADNGYDCEKLYPNEKCIAWDLYKRANKSWCKYYQATIDAIIRYLHNQECNNLCTRCVKE